MCVCVYVCVLQVAVQMLSPKAEFSDAQRAIVLRALGNVSRYVRKQNFWSRSCTLLTYRRILIVSSAADTIKTYDYVLGALVAPYIEETDAPILLRAALMCFPYIRHPVAEVTDFVMYVCSRDTFMELS